MNGKYNFIYKELVSADDDLVGLIAYGIYKKHKIEFITKIKREQGREPSDEECKSFFAASTTDSQLRNYRSQAETMLSEWWVMLLQKSWLVMKTICCGTTEMRYLLVFLLIK